MTTERLELVEYNQKHYSTSDYSLKFNCKKPIYSIRRALKGSFSSIKQLSNGEIFLVIRSDDRIVIGFITVRTSSKDDYGSSFTYYLQRDYSGFAYITEAIKEVYLSKLMQTDILPIVVTAKDSENYKLITTISV